MEEEYALESVVELQKYNTGGSLSDLTSPQDEAVNIHISNQDMKRFVESRHSVRNFDTLKKIPAEIINFAAEMAATTPSVCNRRSYRAHYYEDRETIDLLLSFQNGNSGFGDSVPGLFVVTVRRSSFKGPGERNQRWIDGGLYAMSLVWALHGLGVATCFLNWSEGNRSTSRLRASGGISSSEDIIVLIAVGYAQDGHRIARSPKRDIGDTFVRHVNGE